MVSRKVIYNGYVGWFDGDPVKLLPHPTEAYNQAVLALIGDNDKLILAIKIIWHKKIIKWHCN